MVEASLLFPPVHRPATVVAALLLPGLGAAASLEFCPKMRNRAPSSRQRDSDNAPSSSSAVAPRSWRTAEDWPEIFSRHPRTPPRNRHPTAAKDGTLIAIIEGKPDAGGGPGGRHQSVYKVLEDANRRLGCVNSDVLRPSSQVAGVASGVAVPGEPEAPEASPADPERI